MVDSVNNSASLDVSGVENLKFKYTIYWIFSHLTLHNVGITVPTDSIMFHTDFYSDD